MLKSFTVKTNSPSADLSKPHFFVLSKGLNSGKPLDQPCANCFIITTKCQKLKDQLYWLCFGLWQTKAFHYYLRGSVIPFITINEFKNALTAAYQESTTDNEKFQKSVTALKTLNAQQEQFYKNIQLIEDAKRVVFYRYILKR